MTSNETDCKKRICPQCHAEAARVGAFWICPTHGQLPEAAPAKSLRIFLSYGHDEHVSLAIHLRDDLRNRKHTVWFDEERLQPGHDWEAFIEKGLEHLAADKANAAVILLLTPHSVRRPDGYCLNEVARALSRGLRIIPLMVVESEPPLSICRIQWLDMRQCLPIHEKKLFYRPRFERLLKALEENQLDFEGTQQCLLKALQPLEFDADILRHLPKFTGRQWVFDAIDQWLAGNPLKQRVFWVSGGPGVGKTAISAVLSSCYPEVAALHLCKFGHAQKSDPRSVVTSIVYQLTTQLPEYEARLASMDVGILAQDDAHTMFDNLLVQPLAKLTPPKRSIIILIDALDEATRFGYNALASFIATEFKKTPDWLRLVITSRPDRAVTAPLQALNPFVLETATETNRADIRKYLCAELASLLKGRTDANRIVANIVACSEGVFLYVERVCEDIHSGNLSLDRLDQFPRGLGEAFLQYFNRLVWIDDKDTSRPDYERYKKNFRPALRAILAAREPLPILILQYLLGWKQDELRDFTRSLGSLFPVSIQDGHEVIKPYHKSLSDWLFDEPKAGDFFVSEDEGHKLLAEYGMNEYALGVARMSPYFLRYVLQHLYRAGEEAKAKSFASDRQFIETRRKHGLRCVFISHALDCDELVNNLSKDLTSHGHQVLFPSLEPGDNWVNYMDDTLDTVDTVLLLMTPNSVRPDGFCLKEIALAFQRGLRILPIMVRVSKPPLFLARIQWLDMSDCIGDQSVYSLKLKVLLKAIEQKDLEFTMEDHLIGALRPFDFSSTISEMLQRFGEKRKGFIERQWILNAVQQWLSQPQYNERTDQRVFWVSGGPGVGKTALSAMLSSRYSEIAAVHFCSFGNLETSDPRRVIMSIAYQLSTQLPDYSKHLLALPELAELDRMDSAELSEALLSNPLCKIAPPDRAVVILIDALDEATRDGHNALASLIARELVKTPIWLRFIITSRSEIAVTEPLQGLAAFTLDLNAEANRADLRDYLHGELEPLLVGCPDADRVVKQILDRSGGTLLYVDHICDDIRSGRLSLDQLDSFPASLGGMFHQLFQRQFPDIEKYRKDVRPALRAILAAREPLPVEILQRLFNWQDEELRDFTRAIGSLFPVMKEATGEVIKPYHASVATWLSDEATAGLYFVDLAEGQRLL